MILNLSQTELRWLKFNPCHATSIRKSEMPVALSEFSLKGIKDVVSWVQREKDTINAAILKNGAVLIRHAVGAREEDFQHVVQVMFGEALNYIYRSTPRTTIGKNIYTATEYPANRSIPFHCENSFQREWPLNLMFSCVLPAISGGQTPLADVFGVTKRLSSRLLNEFAERKILYVRNYNEGIDLPWQSVFQTNDVSEVEKFCNTREITFEWVASGLRTKQVCQAVAEHPDLKIPVWFNQAHLFHPSSLDIATRDALFEMFDGSELPRNCFFGDGGQFKLADLAEIRSAFDAEAMYFDWEKGDILILDNMRVAHGRTPFKGDRRVLTAMAKHYMPQNGAFLPGSL